MEFILFKFHSFCVISIYKVGFSMELLEDLGLNETLLSFSKEKEVVQVEKVSPIKFRSIEVIKLLLSTW